MEQQKHEKRLQDVKAALQKHKKKHKNWHDPQWDSKSIIDYSE